MVSQIKVVMITRNFPPDVGGISTHVSCLASHLGGIGLKVDVFRGGSDSRTTALTAVRSLRARDYDIMHLQSLPYGALSTFHPLVVTIHSPVLEEAKYYEGANMIKAPAAFLFEKITLMKADVVIAVSSVTARQLGRQYGVGQSRIRLIPNGVDCDRFNPNLKSSGGETSILLCSRLEPRKNVGEALSAFASMGKEGYRVDIIGEGPDRTELEMMARATQRPITFLGAQSQSELEGHFSKADVFVSTSHSEGFGLSILQAMASGCAIVASNITSHRELIEHGRNGLLYSTQSQLADSLGKLIRDQDLARELGANAREKARNYSWERVAEATANVYEELLS